MKVTEPLPTTPSLRIFPACSACSRPFAVRCTAWSGTLCVNVRSALASDSPCRTKMRRRGRPHICRTQKLFLCAPFVLHSHSVSSRACMKRLPSNGFRPQACTISFSFCLTSLRRAAPREEHQELMYATTPGGRSDILHTCISCSGKVSHPTSSPTFSSWLELKDPLLRSTGENCGLFMFSRLAAMHVSLKGSLACGLPELAGTSGAAPPMPVRDAPWKSLNLFRLLAFSLKLLSSFSFRAFMLDMCSDQSMSNERGEAGAPAMLIKGAAPDGYLGSLASPPSLLNVLSGEVGSSGGIGSLASLLSLLNVLRGEIGTALCCTTRGVEILVS
mmetsp:Transcript_127732/g.238733  ORF Transcript_127732/g.238733 Transcript_127732/m.238733 type:complete len:331 (+) Transcript_127732:630-1622(+)